MPYLSASAVVIHYEEVLYQVYAPLPLTSAKVDQILVSQVCTPYLNDLKLGSVVVIDTMLQPTDFGFSVRISAPIFAAYHHIITSAPQIQL